MKESSGNEQFFVRMIRKDGYTGMQSIDAVVEYSCHQTKYLAREECLERAWWDASYLARFVGLTSLDEVEISNLTDEEIAVMKASITLM